MMHLEGEDNLRAIVPRHFTVTVQVSGEGDLRAPTTFDKVEAVSISIAGLAQMEGRIEIEPMAGIYAHASPSLVIP
ncbi:MAG: hypothetical protein A2Y36_13315 [Treponema sp. GWA1_62_8]|nr:MAG: hypothetical protein A2Y36_13315 [Treponema sp. GWA1_62_8]